MLPTRFAKPISFILATATALGLALHDSKIDTLTTLSVALPAALISYEGANLLAGISEGHTHVERVSLGQLASQSTSLNPWLSARHNEDTRYRLGKKIPKGYHPFDNYNLPLVA